MTQIVLPQTDRKCLQPYTKIILLEVNAHTNFESSRSNSKLNSKFNPKSDLSDLIYSFAIIDKPIEQIENLMRVLTQQQLMLFPVIVVSSSSQQSQHRHKLN